MTREETIKWLKSLKAEIGKSEHRALWHYAEAIDMAIEALQTPPISQRSMYQAGYRQAQEDRPRGEWLETAQDYYETVNKKGGGVNENTEYFTDDIACPNCLAKFSNIDNETERFNFCPNCGADMRGKETDES